MHAETVRQGNVAIIGRWYLIVFWWLKSASSLETILVKGVQLFFPRAQDSQIRAKW